MTYTPKHRGEPKKVYRVEFMESERGWGQNYWHEDYDTMEEAQVQFDLTNAQNTLPYTPDYYIQAMSIKEVVL